jgi:hypothetical protein
MEKYQKLVFHSFQVPLQVQCKEKRKRNLSYAGEVSGSLHMRCHEDKAGVIPKMQVMANGGRKGGRGPAGWREEHWGRGRAPFRRLEFEEGGQGW